jgi:hypothetical protein
MLEFVNPAVALLSILLGAIGWLAPRYTMDVLDMTPGPSTMSFSEVRAASGALFVGLGLGALLIGTPVAYAMVGAAWAGAAIGRATSLVMDGYTPKKLGFFLCEIAVAMAALALNL